MRRFGKSITASAAAIARQIAAGIDPRDVMLAGGVGLLGSGAAQIYPPAGLIVAGAILTGVAILGVRH